MSTRAGAAGKASCRTWRTERAWEGAGEAWKREEGCQGAGVEVLLGVKRA